MKDLLDGHNHPTNKSRPCGVCGTELWHRKRGVWKGWLCKTCALDGFYGRRKWSDTEQKWVVDRSTPDNLPV